jgi:prolipoprotein diacylglyceryltransferase
MFEAFYIGPFLVWSRIIFFLLGLHLTSTYIFRLAHQGNLSLKHFQDFAWYYLINFILCGRIAAIIVQSQLYARDPFRVFILWDGNFSFIGGMFGIALVLYYVTKNHRTTFLQWLDVLLPATCIGVACDWLGRMLSCTSYGRPTDSIFSYTCNSIDVRFVVPIVPVQLYYALFYFVLTFVLLAIHKYSRRAGAETIVGIVLACLFTVYMEFFRGDFSKSVFFSIYDVAVLCVLFSTLLLFAVLERKISPKIIMIGESVISLSVFAYLYARFWLKLITVSTYELRVSQFMALLVLLATVVYVIIHRQKYPHL